MKISLMIGKMFAFFSFSLPVSLEIWNRIDAFFLP